MLLLFIYDHSGRKFCTILVLIGWITILAAQENLEFQRMKEILRNPIIMKKYVNCLVTGSDCPNDGQRFRRK